MILFSQVFGLLDLLISCNVEELNSRWYYGFMISWEAAHVSQSGRRMFFSFNAQERDCEVLCVFVFIFIFLSGIALIDDVGQSHDTTLSNAIFNPISMNVNRDLISL
jgi:hypothetical protein